MGWFVDLFKRVFGTVEEPKVPPTGTRYALSVGINSYPDRSNNLRGCVNDVEDIVRVCATFGFHTEKLLNDSARKNKIRRAIRSLAYRARSGDVVLIHYSGHGTKVADTNQDEIDHSDEALYVWGQTKHTSVYRDDELRADLARFNAGVYLIVVMDCCHSGTITRALFSHGDVEYLEPRRVVLEYHPYQRRQAKTTFLVEKDMNHILITGCKSTEYSYDTRLGNKYRGALTYFLVRELYAVDLKNTTWRQLYKRLRKKLPCSVAPQHPQLEGPAYLKNRAILP